ncbi:response regulator [Marinicella sp. W31]|uniref:hybrid sensor histidine kinase/response regulator transcription factor n=1 Tax=Marinicella sp. W31 TaxID=3023713 RepID=UPI003758068E
MKLSIALIFVCALDLYASNDYAEIGLPVTEIYDTYTHLGSSQLWWLIQKENGMIYSAGNTGISEWDGERWTHYPTPSASRVRALTIWKDNNIYIGTNNDIGHYTVDETGHLIYQSLLTDWSEEDKQFGEIWSVASNDSGVMFLSSHGLFFWDGTRVITIDGAQSGSHRIFAVGDSFYYKANDASDLMEIEISVSPQIITSDYSLEPKATIRQIIQNKNGGLTIFTAQHGVYEIQSGQLFMRTPASAFAEGVNIFNATQSKDGYYYAVSLYDGLYILDVGFNVVKNYREEDGLDTSTLLSVMEDYQGVIWISGVPNIIKMVPPHIYSHYMTESNVGDSENIELVGNRITLVGDSVHQLTINNDPRAAAYFKHITPNRERTWKAISKDDLLIYAGQGGVYSMRLDENGNFVDHHNIFSALFAKSVAFMPEGDKLFVVTTQGLHRLDYIDGEWQEKFIEGTEAELQYLLIDRKKIIWAGSETQILYRVENAHTDDVATEVKLLTEKDGLSPGDVVPFEFASKVVFGTSNGLMQYVEQTETLTFVTELPNLFHTEGTDVYRFNQDAFGRIWFRAGKSAGYIRKKGQEWEINDRIFKHFGSFGHKGFVSTSGSSVWFSTPNAEIYRINVDVLKKLPPEGKLNIRSITSLDSGETYHGGHAPLSMPVLDQKTNSIRIQFALVSNNVLNARSGRKTKYRHRLIGSGRNDFSSWTEEAQKDYTSLSGGDYQFELQAQDLWGRVTQTHFSFNVSPIWYLSKTAWVIYGILFISMMLLSAWLSQRWKAVKLNKRNLELEKLVLKRTEEVQSKADELKKQQVLKDRFFSNVSHEFRTPLTLTIAPLEAILSDHLELDKNINKHINSALSNSKKMLDLIGLVLDINRLEAGSFPLKIDAYNISELIYQTAEKFTMLADQNRQTIHVDCPEETVIAYFDIDQIEKCLANLISNAIKYNLQGGNITIKVIQTNNAVGIEVKDDGPGISHEFEKNIFDRYAQGIASEHITSPGTGIGLALVKELMELHHGDVKLKNVPGLGCEFTLWLKKGSAHFNTADFITQTDDRRLLQNIDKAGGKEQSVLHDDHVINTDLSRILVVDDHVELRGFIADRFSNNYLVIQAANGQDGYDLALSQLPDLIISDVMMPIMDGFEMVRRIKENPLLNAIPIIFLTAKSTKRETVEGLQTGVDDYLVKPFDTSELVTRINLLLKSRKVIRESIKSDLIKQMAGFKETDNFAEKLNANIFEHLGDPNFNVEQLAKNMAMSRITLYRKCQKILNKKPNKIITETRLQHALRLIKEDKYSISEIAYGTGYESLAYFSKSFKKYHGISPSKVNSC